MVITGGLLHPSLRLHTPLLGSSTWRVDISTASRLDHLRPVTAVAAITPPMRGCDLHLAASSPSQEAPSRLPQPPLSTPPVLGQRASCHAHLLQVTHLPAVDPVKHTTLPSPSLSGRQRATYPTSSHSITIAVVSQRAQRKSLPPCQFSPSCQQDLRHQCALPPLRPHTVRAESPHIPGRKSITDRRNQLRGFLRRGGTGNHSR